MIVVLVAVLMPTGTAGAQSGQAECNGAVAVEGRCVAVGDQATVCLGDLCVEFVQESVDVCPGSALNVNSDPATSPRCKLVEPALKGDDLCPDGAGSDIANGGRGRDKPLLEHEIRASDGQFFDGSGCIAETILNCRPVP